MNKQEVQHQEKLVTQVRKETSDNYLRMMAEIRRHALLQEIRVRNNRRAHEHDREHDEVIRDLKVLHTFQKMDGAKHVGCAAFKVMKAKHVGSAAA